jgi:hypothetical protein
MGLAPKRTSDLDLFSASSVRGPSSLPVHGHHKLPSNDAPIGSSSPRNVLPGNLSTAIKQLGDQELDRLYAAVVEERKRRNKKSSTPDDRRPGSETRPNALTKGQINAVHAAFKAGITPSRIARQFGLSLSDVRKALAVVK